MKNVLITGGTGLVGTRLTALLEAKNHTVGVLTRSPQKDAKQVQFKWDINAGQIEDGAVDFADIIIHLAGAGIADKAWTDEYKQAIRDSRIKSGELLFSKFKDSNRLQQFLGASAIGIYKDAGSTWIDEDSIKATDFLGEVCKDWEKVSLKFSEAGVKTTINRIGIVLSKDGGALPQMKMPINFGIGGYLGDGLQFYPWIHLDDLCRMMIHQMENNVEGIFSAVAPQPETNKAFTKELGKHSTMPTIMMPVPAFLLRIILGEKASLVLNSYRIKAEKVKSTGFEFNFPELGEALSEIYN